jgi:two-component system, cell cycle sensor histidine kinase and response regulator CckA
VTPDNPVVPDLQGQFASYPHTCLYQAVVEQAVDAVMVIDDTFTVLFKNGSSDAPLGYAPGEWVGRRVLDFIHPDDVPAVTSAFNAVRQNSHPCRALEHRFRHHDGSWRVFESIGQYCPALPGGAAVVVISREIATRRRLESEVARARRTEAMELMTGAIVHDFSNLLIVLTACTDALEDEPRKLTSTLITMRAALERASTLTRQLLVFAKPAEVVQPGSVNVNQAVTDLRPVLRLLLGPTVELQMSTTAKEASVGVAHAAFDQIVINLATNARDAMPAGGELSISTSNVRAPAPALAARPGPGDTGVHTWLVLEVADTGMGMIGEIRARIFEPFFTTKVKSRGTGLGLPTILAIVRRAAGHVYVESTPGRGSTFRVFLPVVQ